MRPKSRALVSVQVRPSGRPSRPPDAPIGARYLHRGEHDPCPHPGAAEGRPLGGIIQGLFDLTAAEARITRGIAAGRTISQLAEEAGVREGTVRSQIKAVFGKMAVSRQAETVALLGGGGLSF